MRTRYPKRPSWSRVDEEWEHHLFTRTWDSARWQSAYLTSCPDCPAGPRQPCWKTQAFKAGGWETEDGRVVNETAQLVGTFDFHEARFAAWEAALLLGASDKHFFDDIERETSDG